MWWDLAPAMQREFEDWHTHEHFPERLGVPGFLRASRWTSAQGGEGVFVLYELQGYPVLSSREYLARLNAPTPWSAKLMPHHRNMVRTQNHVLESRGAAIARLAMTIRMSPAPDRAGELRPGLASLIEEAASAPGISGVHLLRHQAPAIAQTMEQRMRGSADRAADWALIVCAYEAGGLEALAGGVLSAESLQRLGASADQVRDTYALSSSATPPDVR
jgi:hypothetical protein